MNTSGTCRSYSRRPSCRHCTLHTRRLILVICTSWVPHLPWSTLIDSQTGQEATGIDRKPLQSFPAQVVWDVVLPFESPRLIASPHGEGTWVQRDTTVTSCSGWPRHNIAVLYAAGSNPGTQSTPLPVFPACLSEPRQRPTHRPGKGNTVHACGWGGGQCCNHCCYRRPESS